MSQVALDLIEGYAQLGSLRLPVAADSGGIRVGGAVLRTVSFGERDRAVRLGASSARPRAGVAHAVRQAATIVAGEVDARIAEVLALHLAGARPGAPTHSFDDALLLVASAAGWSPDQIAGAEATLVDRLADRAAPVDSDDGWNRIVLGGGTAGEGLDALRDAMADALLERIEVEAVMDSSQDKSPGATVSTADARLADVQGLPDREGECETTSTRPGPTGGDATGPTADVQRALRATAGERERDAAARGTFKGPSERSSRDVQPTSDGRLRAKEKVTGVSVAARTRSVHTSQSPQQVAARLSRVQPALPARLESDASRPTRASTFADPRDRHAPSSSPAFSAGTQQVQTSAWPAPPSPSRHEPGTSAARMAVPEAAQANTTAALPRVDPLELADQLADLLAQEADLRGLSR